MKDSSRYQAWAVVLLLLPGIIGILTTRVPAQQGRPAPEPIQTLQKQSEPSNRIDSILANIETGKDGWLTELYNEEIQFRLADLKKLLARKPFEREKLAFLIAPGFRGSPLRPATGTLLRSQSPTVFAYQLEKDRADLPVTAATLPGELESWLAEFEEISYQELKTTGIEIEQAPLPRVRVPLRYSISGRTHKGEILQLTGHWTTHWQKDPGRGWLWTGITLDEGWESRSPRPLFTDVSACALPKGPAYEQLRRGVDWWTANLDAAAGMQIQGHNGVAVADVDGDGQEDFYVCQGSGLPNRLFHNQGDGTFTDISAQAGVDILDRVSGALFFDYDNDGDQDLLLTGHELFLLQNDGSGRFALQDSSRMGLTPARTQDSLFFSTCVADYNRDGWLDIYVCSYFRVVGRGDESIPTPYYNATNGAPNFLFQNNGDGTFTDVTEKTGLDAHNDRFSFACAWADYDKNGYPDLYVANDFGRNNLYRNNGAGAFSEVSEEAGVTDIAAGMSATWTDYDNDGWLDLYVSNMYSTAGLRTTAQPLFKSTSGSSVRASYRRHARGNSLFRNRGDGTFEDVSQSAGITMGRWAWSSNFFDFDLDGWEDIYVTNGYVTNESNHDL